MDRFGIFVDAGYLFAASGELCFGESNRNLLSVDFRQVVSSLRDRAEEHCGLSHLRTYWYDGAREARPTPQHLDVANLPGVKLRLGRLVRGRQKGVDSRIVRDLIVLSQERGIAVAYLLGGDEDLREGVIEAQERGVRVALMAIEPLNEQNLSPTLAMEADDIIVLDKTFVEPYIELRGESATEPGEAKAAEKEPLTSSDLKALGRSFAVKWKNEAQPADVDAIIRGRPRIPSELDRGLLQGVTADIGRPHLEDPERAEIRAGFWQGLLTDLDSTG